MCNIIREMTSYWIIGLLVLWSGVITAGNATAAPGVGTAISNEISAFIIGLKITNRIYNDSLEDHKSHDYKILRQDVEKVFLEMYSFTPSAQFQEIAEMTFSNGSVIANSTVLFGTKKQSGQTVKNIFLSNYQQHPSMLDLNINYTAEQEPIPVPLSLLSNIAHSITSLNASLTSPDDHPNTESSDHNQSGNESSTASSLVMSGPDKSIDSNNATTITPQTHSTNNASDFTHSTPQTTSNSISNNNTAVHSNNINSTMSASTPLTMTVHSSRNISSTTSSSPLTTTMHSSSNISNISSSSPSTMTGHPSSNISDIPASTSSTPAVHPSNNMSAMATFSTSTTTVHPSNNISAMSTSGTSVTPGKTTTQKPTAPEETDTVATEQGVPGWGIAILVLAAIILFFMLVLLILLLLFWCCWWRQRGFMNVSDPDPTGYYNPDIPMYSTHSTFDSHNGKSLMGL